MKKKNFTFLVLGLFVLFCNPSFAQSYGFYTEKPGNMLNGDFLTDPSLVDPVVRVRNYATVSYITSGHVDSVFFGTDAIHATFTDDADGKDRLEFYVASQADFSFFNAGVLTFWIKLLQPLDIHFEVNANRNDGGEIKGTDVSMVDQFGLDLGNTDWQKITIDLSGKIKNDFFNYNMFESIGFRSRGNACDFIIDEVHVALTSPLARYLNDVATLDDLTVSSGTLDPSFDPGITSYDVELPGGTTSVVITATPTDPNATITGDGEIDVSSGTAVATVTVTAEDGKTTMNYVVNFTVASLNNVATLDNLTVSSGTLDPAFDPAVTSYDVELAEGTTSVVITATPTDPNATITGDGEIDVSSGTAVATVTVTAEDGTTTMDYVVNFTVLTDIPDDNLTGISIYPNPANRQLFIRLGYAKASVVELSNLLGQTLSVKKVQGDMVVFDVSMLSEGLYIVNIDGKQRCKVMIKK